MSGSETPEGLQEHQSKLWQQWIGGFLWQRKQVLAAAFQSWRETDSDVGEVEEPAVPGRRLVAAFLFFGIQKSMASLRH